MGPPLWAPNGANARPPAPPEQARWAAALAAIPKVEYFEHRTRFYVKKKGAHLRRGGSLSSEFVTSLAGGTRVLADKTWPLDAKTTRCHLLEPVVGWVSLKRLERKAVLYRSSFRDLSPQFHAFYEATERAASVDARTAGERWWRAIGDAVVRSAPRRSAAAVGALRAGARVVGAGAGAALIKRRAPPAPTGVEGLGAGTPAAWVRLADSEAAAWFGGSRLSDGTRRGAWVRSAAVALVDAGEATALDAAALAFHPERRARCAAMAATCGTSAVGLAHLRPAEKRFCFAPSKRTWEANIALACACEQDALTPSYDERLPPAPPSRGCWLVPTEDAWALKICEGKAALERLGWRVLAGSKADTVELMDKVKLRGRAERLGVGDVVPAYYRTLSSAKYPCIVKTAIGDFGSTVRVAQDAAGVRQAMADLKLDESGLGKTWLVSELCEGPVEYSTSCAVKGGKILDIVRTRYTYAEAVYVWPRVEEKKGLRVVDSELPPEHLAVFSKLLVGYTGICNFNYKLRSDDGRLCLFEVNVRSGEDLGGDVPPARLRCFLERLDGALPAHPTLGGPPPSLVDTRPRASPRRPAEAPF